MEDTHEPVISGITFMGYSQNWKTKNPNNKPKNRPLQSARARGKRSAALLVQLSSTDNA